MFWAIHKGFNLTPLRNDLFWRFFGPTDRRLTSHKSQLRLMPRFTLQRPLVPPVDASEIWGENHRLDVCKKTLYVNNGDKLPFLLDV